jgi:iron complex outermembrane receptor protein
MKMTGIYRGTAIGLTAFCMASVAAAQDAPRTAPEQAAADAGTTGEIIVTAQKRSESVQKIPLAVSAIGGDSLQQRGATGLSALGQVVPGLNVSEQVGQARLTLRGIGVDNISTGAESSVAFNQDGIFYSRSAAALASFYDVDRVEVLRGPQGTLYGRNATGGSVNIITNGPTNSLHGALNLTGGNRETINGDGYLSGPLSDTVSARLSFQVQHHDGYGKNLVTGSDIDTKNSQAVRGQLRFKPTDRLSILVAADYYRSRDRSNSYHYFGPAGVTPAGAPITPTSLLLGGFAPASRRDIAAAHDPKARANFYGGRVDVGYEVSDNVTVRSLSAYRRSDYQVHSDISPLAVDLFPLTVTEKSDQFTQEFQLNIDKDSNKFVAGVFYLHETIDGSLAAPLNLLAVGGPNFFVQGFFAGGRLKTDAAAAYAQDTYSLTDALRLTLGGRFSWERKGVNDQSDFSFAMPYSPTNVPLVPHHIDDKTFKSFTPKIGIDIDLAPRTLAYASFSKGFKSGTYNLGSGGPPLRPEKVDAYEAGLKTTLADGMFRANIAGFYYNYSDLQVGKVQGQLVVLENAATARIYGLEGEFVARPVPDLSLSVNASWLHARFRSYTTADQARPSGDGATFVNASGVPVAAGTPGAVPAFNLSGNTLPQSPNYTISLAAEYAFHLPKGTLTVRGESNWSDRVYFSPFNRAPVSQPAYSLQNAFVSYDNGENWRLSAFIKNIANKTILASGQVATSLLGSPVIGFVQPPRTFGATVGYRF